MAAHARRISEKWPLLQWKRGCNRYLMLPGNGKINYVALAILNENFNTLASDKRPSLSFSYQNVYFKTMQIETAKGIEFFLGGVLYSVRKTYLFQTKLVFFLRLKLSRAKLSKL